MICFYVKHILDDQCNESVIATDGSRFDVYLNQRIRKPVYWSDNTTDVRRCSWFLRNSNGSNFIPYSENIATLLEVIDISALSLIINMILIQLLIIFRKNTKQLGKVMNGDVEFQLVIMKK